MYFTECFPQYFKCPSGPTHSHRILLIVFPVRQFTPPGTLLTPLSICSSSTDGTSFLWLQLFLLLPPKGTWFLPGFSIYSLVYSASVLSLRNYPSSRLQWTLFKCVFLKETFLQFTLQLPTSHGLSLPGQASYPWNLSFKPNLRPI